MVWLLRGFNGSKVQGSKSSGKRQLPMSKVRGK